MPVCFAPAADLMASTMLREEEGRASGVNKTVHEVDGVFGVAVPT